jgi:hypothetical protein
MKHQSSSDFTLISPLLVVIFTWGPPALLPWLRPNSLLLHTRVPFADAFSLRNCSLADPLQAFSYAEKKAAEIGYVISPGRGSYAISPVIRC